jgi:hypothetical protein
LSKNPTNSDLEHIPVAVVKNSLMIESIELPLDSRMDRIVMVEVKGRSGGKGLGFVVFEMKVGFPENRSV